ncbi:bifunctional nicotinamidase/pyrazinamidase [Halarsenatibacter silvermanii]|uniref:nicotinamidase n=1 Tax=Halarsenatibacter silvermanii TaxID=321763 RepID=A0A1G9LKW2_9FIRM|nr:bifunctional nicotinamidase/pyrazinamidase [Halarsenatibacter silvermanii]SDL62498.1 nicotinamidase/pyrazinamidase [Halarsenatibacter silvermanii]
MAEKALLCVDLQYDFYEDGALAVPGASKINPRINELMDSDGYRTIAASQDWHPPEHMSFAKNHDKEPLAEYEGDNEGIGPVLWPEHCQQGTRGAAFHEDINTRRFDMIMRKGQKKMIDSYSAFQDNNGRDLGLADYFRGLDIEVIDIAGLALDVCVYYTVCDALKYGFDVNLIRPAARGVNARPGDVEEALKDMKDRGAEIIEDMENV